MPNVTIETASNCFDKQRERKLIAKITELVAEHLDEPAPIRVRLYLRETPVRALSQSSPNSPLRQYKEPSGKGALGRIIRIQRGRFGRKVVA